MQLSVFGCGYLGAVHAASMAELGHEVVGIDIDPEKIAELSAGRAPFFEPKLQELLERALASGRLKFSTDAAVASDADVHFMAVGTPQRKGEYAADLTWVDMSFADIRSVAKPGSLIVGKSTVPVGTSSRLAAQLTESNPEVIFAWNPEFLREGHAVDDTIAPDRLVFGLPPESAGEASRKRARELLSSVYADAIARETPVVWTDYETAELVKASANAFLATKISFINAMAEVCEASGADVTQLADAIGFDARIGRSFLNAGLGFGGGCLPKDIRAFMARAGELGADQALTFLREVDAINQRRRSRAVDLAREVCGGSLIGRRIAVLGLSFKPHSDDVRDSPALNVAVQLELQGATVTATDPEAIRPANKRFPDLNYADTVDEAVRDADAVMLLTEWPEYRELDPAKLSPLVRERAIVDGRNCLDPKLWREAGWVYRALGRP